MSATLLASPEAMQGEPYSSNDTSESLRGPTRLASGAAYALGDQVVFSFGNMVVAALVSRHGSLADLGIYILTQRAMDVMIQLSNGILWTPYTFELPRLSEQRRALYRGSVLFWQVCLCLAFSGLLWTVAEVGAWSGARGLELTFVPLVATSGCILFREFTRRMYLNELRLREAFWTDVATNGLQIAGMVLLVHLQMLSVTTTLGVLAAGSFVVSLWWVLREWRSWKFAWQAAVCDLRRDFRMGGWLFGGNMLALVTAQCNPWVLNAMLGARAVGTYSICESLVNIPRAGLTSLQNVMGPLVARAHGERGVAGLKASVKRMSWTLLVLSTGAGVLLFCAAPQVAKLIYGYSPANARVVTTLLSVNLVVFTTTLAQMYGLTALRRPQGAFFANLAGVVVQLMLCGWLVRSLQVVGAATGLLLGNLVVMLVRQVIYTQTTRRTALLDGSAVAGSMVEA